MEPGAGEVEGAASSLHQRRRPQLDFFAELVSHGSVRPSVLMLTSASASLTPAPDGDDRRLGRLSRQRRRGALCKLVDEVAAGFDLWH